MDESDFQTVLSDTDRIRILIIKNGPNMIVDILYPWRATGFIWHCFPRS